MTSFPPGSSDGELELPPAIHSDLPLPVPVRRSVPVEEADQGSGDSAHDSYRPFSGVPEPLPRRDGVPNPARARLVRPRREPVSERPPRKRANTGAPDALGLLAWVVFSTGWALVDASRPNFRILSGIDSMFRVARVGLVDQDLLFAGVFLWVFALGLSCVGALLALTSARPVTPWVSVSAMLVTMFALSVRLVS